MRYWYNNCFIFCAGIEIGAQTLRKHLSLLAVAVVTITAGCGSDSGDTSSEEKKAPQLTAATLGEQTILEVSEYLAQAQFEAADRKNGAAQARICKACHSFDAGGANMLGPGLHGFFDRQVGERKGFDYSPVMRNANFRWTPRALDSWLAQPGRFLPGNRMTFAGVMKRKDRDDLIAYLLDTTSRTVNE